MSVHIIAGVRILNYKARVTYVQNHTDQLKNARKLLFKLKFNYPDHNIKFMNLYINGNTDSKQIAPLINTRWCACQTDTQLKEKPPFNGTITNGPTHNTRSNVAI